MCIFNVLKKAFTRNENYLVLYPIYNKDVSHPKVGDGLTQHYTTVYCPYYKYSKVRMNTKYAKHIEPDHSTHARGPPMI